MTGLNPQLRIGTDWFEYPKDKEDEIIRYLDQNAERTNIRFKSFDVQQIILSASNFVWNVNAGLVVVILEELVRLGIKKIKK